MNKILLLSNNDKVKPVYEWLNERYDVTLFHEPLSVDIITAISPDLVISYNYHHIVREDVLSLMGDRIINMHISYLPWNKGADPNIWSFIDDTPKGVTIHRMEKGCDTGKIIFQKQITFDESRETLHSTYTKLHEEIVELLIGNWDDIRTFNYTLKDQDCPGSSHRRSDLVTLLKGRQIDYSMTIKEFKEFISTGNN